MAECLVDCVEEDDREWPIEEDSAGSRGVKRILPFLEHLRASELAEARYDGGDVRVVYWARLSCALGSVVQL